MADSSLNSVDLPDFKGPSSDPPSPDALSSSTERRSNPVSFSIGGRVRSASGSASGSRVHPFPIVRQGSPSPLLPRTKRATFSRHRHDANPALAIKVLQDIQAAVDDWHYDLKQTVMQIQAVYLEGPIVDGWLEAVETPVGQSSQSLDAAILRHADPNELSGYIDRLCQGQSGSAPPDSGTSFSQTGRSTRYRLCTLDADGRLNCLICPDQQLTTISLAVARNQKLRQLLNHKNYLEARLKRAVEVLSQVREDLDIPATASTEIEPDYLEAEGQLD